MLKRPGGLKQSRDVESKPANPLEIGYSATRVAGGLFVRLDLALRERDRRFGALLARGFRIVKGAGRAASERAFASE
jgi:hypothetical protein